MRKNAQPAAAITVLVRGGSYELGETLRFRPEDGGRPSPVVYRAYPGERPIIRGAAGSPASSLIAGQILKADLAAQGLKGATFKELFYAGQRLPLARYPNFDPENPYGGGWAFADGKLVPMYQDQPGEDQPHAPLQGQPTRAPGASPSEVEVFVFPRYNWWNNIVPIKAIDRTTRTITLAGDASYPIRPGDRYYVRNALEELDAPGEWYLDRDVRHALLLAARRRWTRSTRSSRPSSATLIAIEPGTVAPHAPRLHPRSVHGRGRRAAPNRRTARSPAARSATSATTTTGLSASTRAEHNRIVGNDISDVGSHGISLSGGDRVTLTPAENYADNNYIHHIGVLYKQGVGIALDGVGNRASHNLIHDGPRMGIMFSGNNLVIEYNHIRHMNLETEDTGAVYTGGRDWISSRGTVIRYN